jgi:hypothetical protein
LLKYGRQHTTKNGAANPRLKATMICVEGIIIPANWDNKGNVVDLVLAARDEEEYLIRDKEQVTRLKSFLRQEVKIKGILRTKEGKKIIKVKKFSKLKKPD